MTLLMQIRVRREGTVQSIPVADLVVGDVLLFEAGDILPADGILLDGFDIRVDESNLTGTMRSVTSERDWSVACPRLTLPERKHAVKSQRHVPSQSISNVPTPTIMLLHNHMSCVGEADDVYKCPREGPNILFSGSQVMSGYGSMLAAAVGPSSQAGKIMLMTRGQQIQVSSSSGSESEASELTSSENPYAPPHRYPHT